MDKVILAFEGEKTTGRVRELLESSGLANCLICRSAAEVKRTFHKQHIAMVVCGYKLRDETAQSLYEDLPPASSVLVIASQNMLDMIDSDDIFKLAAPVSRGDLISSVRMLLQASHRMEKFVHPQRSAAETVLIQRAKGLLMERNGMTEEQAHRFLQKRSMDSGARLAQTAQMVLDESWLN